MRFSTPVLLQRGQLSRRKPLDCFFFPVPPQSLQMILVSFFPWQLVQRSLPSPEQTLQIPTALIDLDSAARWSRSMFDDVEIADSACTGRSKPRFFCCT